jgi:sugar phosphate isomerase/epimerase
MNIGITQLAFENVSDLINNISDLQKIGVENIELVFSKFKNDTEINHLKKLLIQYNITSKSSQSILFNSNIKDFNDNNIINHISYIIEKSELTNSDVLILGSPSCRNIFNFYNLRNIFKDIDNRLIASNKILCIEPNCKNYGGKYFYNVEEIINFIDRCKFKNIKTMIDTDNLINENVDIVECYKRYYKYIYHIHVSENKLQPFLKSNFHYNLSDCLAKHNYNRIITYESLPHKNIIETSKNFIEVYGKQWT